jgi:hypothetical protein
VDARSWLRLACGAVALGSCAAVEQRVEDVSAVIGRWQTTHAGCNGSRLPEPEPVVTLTISRRSATLITYWACTHSVSEIPLQLSRSGLLLDVSRGRHHCAPAECALSLGVVEGTAKRPSGCAIEEELPMRYEATTTDGGNTLVLRSVGSEQCAMLLRKQ